VSIRVQNIDTGNLLVKNKYLSKDAINKELAMEGVNPITEVTISPVLKTNDTSSVSTEPALSGTAIAGIVVAVTITAIVFMCITYCNVKNRKNLNVDLMPLEEVRQQEGEENHCMYSTDSHRLMREEEEARKKREEEDTLSRLEEGDSAGPSQGLIPNGYDLETQQQGRKEEDVRRRRKEEEPEWGKWNGEERERKKKEEEEAGRKREEKEAEKKEHEVDTTKTEQEGDSEYCNQAKKQTDEVPHIPFSELSIDEKHLASGSFKSVYKAKWVKRDRSVALLILRNSDRAAISDMENEIRIFSTLGKHRHLAVLLATCTHPDSYDKCMVMEFANLGSLDHVLNNAAERGTDVSNLVLIAVAMQAAEGMVHLHLHDIVHRDLAARNILVFQFDYHDWKQILVKVTDYGLSLLANKGYAQGSSDIEISTIGTNAGRPMRYMAVESIQRRAYSKKTDSWSCGVLFYEIFTLGMIPFFDISDDREVARVVLAGERLPQPQKCSDHLYAIMKNCWQSAPKDRPSMSAIQANLQEAFAEEMVLASKTECVICLNAVPVMALLPCGHMCACEGCGPMLETCPICRAAVQEAKRIFG